MVNNYFFVLRLVKNFLKKNKFHLKKKIKPGGYYPHQIYVRKCKWRNDASAPVVFMIDDLTNAWFDKNSNGTLDLGEDWGAGGWERASALSFLSENLLNENAEIKTTFFTVIGKMAPFRKGTYFTKANRIDDDSKSLKFFRSLFFDTKFELAYHGLTHGKPADTSDGKFIQEWETFSTQKEAVSQNSRGIQFFKKCFGQEPFGGKYGGYKFNEFGEKSIDLSKFGWWCRYWYDDGSFNNKSIIPFDLTYFGENRVVDIPSNLHGFWWSKKQIIKLLEKRQIVAIQEHIAPYRVDGKIQTPNIVDDINELKKLFKFLKTKNVWFATCGEVAEYFIGFTDSLVYDVTKNGFKMNYWGKISNPLLSITLNSDCLCSENSPLIEIALPNGVLLAKQGYEKKANDFNHLITIPVMTGQYNVSPVSQEPHELKAQIDKDFNLKFNFPSLAGDVEIDFNSEFFFYVVNKSKGTRVPLKKKSNDIYSFYCINSDHDFVLEEYK